MKVVLLCRNSAGARYIAQRLVSADCLYAIVVESGKVARKQKIRREIRNARWYQIAKLFADILAVLLYSMICERYLASTISPHSFPATVPLQGVENANSDECVTLISSLDPDVIIVYGASILKTNVLKIARSFTLNIHGGIVPAYRNVHSDFWAFMNEDYNRIGTSIMHLDSGIDTGEIALQRSVNIVPGDHILSVRRKNLELAGNLILEAIDRINTKTLPRLKQEGSSGFYRTPGLLDLIPMIFKRVRSEIE